MSARGWKFSLTPLCSSTLVIPTKPTPGKSIIPQEQNSGLLQHRGNWHPPPYACKNSKQEPSH